VLLAACGANASFKNKPLSMVSFYNLTSQSLNTIETITTKEPSQNIWLIKKLAPKLTGK